MCSCMSGQARKQWFFHLPLALWVFRFKGIATRSAMHNYSLAAHNVRPPQSYKLLWGRMRFGSFRIRKKAKRWVCSECWTRCRICKDIQPVCVFSVPVSVRDNFTPTPTLPSWESEPESSVHPSGPDQTGPNQAV